MRKALAMATATDVGQVRQRNEDCVAVDATHGLAILADGLGGYNAGDVASTMAVALLMHEITNRLDRRVLAEKNPQKNLESIIREGVANSNAAVYQTAMTQAQYAGMGATLVLAAFHDNQILCAHIGDSRLYRLRGEQFEQLTHDHSLLQQQIDQGVVVANALDRFHSKNLVTRALGVDPQVEVDVQSLPTQINDIYLLCSDGLTDMASDDDIRDTIDLKQADLEQAAQALVKLANDNGGHDNISVALVKVRKPFPARGGFLHRIGKRLFV